MFKAFKFYGSRLALAGLLLAPPALVAQDLGSTNKLFRPSNPTTKKTAPAEKKSAEKKSAKPKIAAAKKAAPKPPTPKPAATRAARKNSPAPRSNQAAARPKTVENKPPASTPNADSELTTSVIIRVGEPKPVRVYKPLSAAAEALYDRTIEEGNRARDRRAYKAAESAYHRALQINPQDARAIYGLGNLFNDQQRWEEAEKAYRQAIILEPEAPEAFIALSFVLTQPVGVNPVERYAEAAVMARKAAALDPENAVAHDQLGAALELGGKIDRETEDAYRRAISLDPNFALAHAHLGRLLRRNGRAPEAAAADREAIRLASDVPTMILIADVLQSQQRFVESEQLLRRALRSDAKNPTALFLLGRALTTKGNFDEAEKVLRRSVEVSPNSFVSYTLLGSLYARRGKFDEAERTLSKALNVVSAKERRRLSAEFEAVGDGLTKAGRHRDAARVYEQALALTEEKTSLTFKLNKAQNSL